MAETDITELEELAAEKVAGVQSPANGTPFLLLKAASEEACSTCHGTGKIRDGHMDCPDCSGPAEKEVGAEEEQIEEEVTGEALKAKLKAKQRNALPDSDFAYIDSKGKRHLPIPDASHVRNALSRFDQTEFESAKAKATAKRKIMARAKRLGVDASGAKKASPGVPAEATQTPVEGGVFNATGQSGGDGSETETCPQCHGAGYLPTPDDPAQERPGVACPTCDGTGQVIPAEAKVTNNPKGTTAAKTAAVITSLVEAIDLLAYQRKAEKKGKSISMPNPQGAEAQIGSGPWEDYDSASLQQVAETLAGCGKALDAITQREAVEAAAGNEGDVQDTFDLQMASEALDAALGVVARLAFSEGAAGTALAQKSGRVLSAKNEEHLRQARDHLNHVLAGVNPTKAGEPGESEEDQIMTTVTKEDLAATIAGASAAAVKAAMAEERKQAIKAAKKAAKVERKAAKKNANNGGDITAQQEQAQVRGIADASDVNAVPNGGKTDSQYINKAKDGKALKAVAGQLEATAQNLARLEEQVSRFANRPRNGGPVLDGQARGAFPAAESRLSKGADKSADPELEGLSKAVESASDPYHKADAAQQLTLARLRKAHEAGVI